MYKEHKVVIAESLTTLMIEMILEDCADRSGGSNVTWEKGDSSCKYYGFHLRDGTLMIYCSFGQ